MEAKESRYVGVMQRHDNDVYLPHLVKIVAIAYSTGHFSIAAYDL
jgi:hypothetical protein